MSIQKFIDEWQSLMWEKFRFEIGKNQSSSLFTGISVFHGFEARNQAKDCILG